MHSNRTPNFSLYLNDFSEKIKGDYERAQFADDTSILCRYMNQEKQLQQKLKKFY